jgi:hypothetical protein
VKAPSSTRLRLLLGLLLLFFGADQAVALAQEIRAEGETGHAWMGASGVRAAPGSTFPGGPDGAVALPARALEIPEPEITVRAAAAPPRRPSVRSRGAPRREYPRGPPILS